MQNERDLARFEFGNIKILPNHDLRTIPVVLLGKVKAGISDYYWMVCYAFILPFVETGDDGI